LRAVSPGGELLPSDWLCHKERGGPNVAACLTTLRQVFSEAETCRLKSSARSEDLAENRAGLRTCPNTIHASKKRAIFSSHLEEVRHCEPFSRKRKRAWQSV